MGNVGILLAEQDEYERVKEGPRETQFHSVFIGEAGLQMCMSQTP